MAKNTEAPSQDEGALVRVVLTQSHELPGLVLQPGKARVSVALQTELRALGKLSE